jgi:hypothetical protein
VKLSDLTDEQWFQRLSARRNAQTAGTPTDLGIKQWWEYYDGTQPLYYLLRILEEQDDRFGALTINWCEKFVDSVDQRCYVEGFTLNGQDSPDDELWATWVRNDMPEYQSENNVASLVTGNSYIMVGPSDEGALITVESPDSMAVEIDPLTRRVVAALKFYKSDSEATLDDRAVLHVPNYDGTGSRLIEFEAGKAVNSGTKQGWMSGAAKLQGSPEVPVVAFPNRQRQRQGRSELRSLRPVVDAANFVATSMMASVLHHAMPRMLAINVAESLFLNDDGSVNREAVKSATGALWVVPAETDADGNVPDKAPVPDVKQLPASEMRNFHETLNTLGRIGSGLCGLSPHTFGFGVADNPASADGIRASRDDLVARVERIQMARGNGYERVMRLAMAVEGRDPALATGMQSQWRSAATPTMAAAADAAVKMYAGGSGLADKHQARVDYGYSAETIKAMEEREANAASDPELAAAVDELRRLRERATGVSSGTAPSGG